MSYGAKSKLEGDKTRMIVNRTKLTTESRIPPVPKQGIVSAVTGYLAFHTLFNTHIRESSWISDRIRVRKIVSCYTMSLVAAAAWVSEENNVPSECPA